VFKFTPRPLYPGNESMYPVNKKPAEFQSLYGHFGENKKFLHFPTDDP